MFFFPKEKKATFAKFKKLKKNQNLDYLKKLNLLLKFLNN
jgi:hypothetical protein